MPHYCADGSQEKKRQMADFKERAQRSKSEGERRILLYQVGKPQRGIMTADRRELAAQNQGWQSKATEFRTFSIHPLAAALSESQGKLQPPLSRPCLHCPQVISCNVALSQPPNVNHAEPASLDGSIQLLGIMAGIMVSP